MLGRADIGQALTALGYQPCEFYDDSIYPLLEQPIPLLCADRLDYFLRDGLACGVVTTEFVQRMLGSLAVVDMRIVLRDVEVAREAASLFAMMNRDWWASPIEAFVYNEFADALREGLRLGILSHDDLMTEDDLVLAKLDAAKSRKITGKLRDTPRSAGSNRGVRGPDRPQGALAGPAGGHEWDGAANVGPEREKEAIAAGGMTNRSHTLSKYALTCRPGVSNPGEP